MFTVDDCALLDTCATVPVDDFLPEVLLRSPGASDEIAANYVREACIEFCFRSKLLRQEIVVDLQACVPDIILEPECDLQIVALHAVKDMALHFSSYNVYTGRAARLTMSNGVSVRFVPPNTLSLESPPTRTDVRGVFKALISVAPKRDACDIPELLYQRYRQVITEGAMARMHLIKKTDFYSLADAKMAQDKFDRGCTTGNLDRLTGFKTAGPYPIHPRGRIV